VSPPRSRDGRPDGCTAELEGGPRGTDSRQWRAGCVAMRETGGKSAFVPRWRKQRDSCLTHVLPNVEVTRPERHGALAARRSMDNERFAARAACRGGSG
jgi:hypothetical protein